MSISSNRLAVRHLAIPCLEQLEDRTLPSSGSAGAVVPPPSQFQASRSLFIDAAFLETQSLLQAYVSNFGSNRAALDEFPAVPSVTTDAAARASAAGVNLNTLISLGDFLSSVLVSERIQGSALDDILFNLPYAGPFAPFALKAGMDAALQAVQK